MPRVSPTTTPPIVCKPLTELINDFAERRKAVSVHTDTLRTFADSSVACGSESRPQSRATRTADVDRWLGGEVWHPITKNNVRKI